MYRKISVSIEILIISVSVFITIFGLQAKPAPQANKRGAVIKSRVFLVNLFISALSGKNYVRDLKKEDFSIYENGIPQKIAYFRNLSKARDIPLTIAMLVDTSASVADKLQQEIQTAEAFFKSTLRPDKDLACILEFGSEVVLVADFTFDLERLEHALESLRPGGNTSLYDAVYLASEEKLKGEAGRKIIVILSDGEDTNSSMSQKDAIKAAQKSDVMIYGLGVRSSGYRANFGALRRFCKETGGKFFSPRASVRELQRTFDLIKADINHQYNIAYYPKNQNRDATYRKIKVKVHRRGVKLFYRKGYFAPSK